MVATRLGGSAGALASVELLLDAEERARKLADKLIRKHRLEDAREQYRREARKEATQLLRQATNAPPVTQ